MSRGMDRQQRVVLPKRIADMCTTTIWPTRESPCSGVTLRTILRGAAGEYESTCHMKRGRLSRALHATFTRPFLSCPLLIIEI